MTFTMKVVQGKPHGSILTFHEGEFVVGCGPECQVRLNSELISRQHCLLRVCGDAFLVRDLGSTYGTLVNGNPIVKHFLRDRDEIDIGRHKFVYCTDENEVISSRYVARGMLVAAGDLGEEVDAAKPITRARRAGGDTRSQKSVGLGKDPEPAKPRMAKSTTAAVRSTLVETPAAAPIPPSPKPSVKVLSGPP